MKPRPTISDCLPNATKTDIAKLNIELLGLAPSKTDSDNGFYRAGYNQAISEYEQAIIKFLEG